MYLEMIGSLILLAAGVSVVAQRGTITAGNAGLSIAFALQVREFGIRWSPIRAPPVIFGAVELITRQHKCWQFVLQISSYLNTL